MMLIKYSDDLPHTSLWHRVCVHVCIMLTEFENYAVKVISESFMVVIVMVYASALSLVF